jgi:dTDP-4-dehydrorhamnose 3,5-epimerase
MNISPTRMSGPLLIQPTVHGDERGFFVETFRADTLAEAGVTVDFVQDNHSRSGRGTVRGMHFQPGQWKLIRAVRGAMVDVIVDIRVGSPTFGDWESFALTDENHSQLLIPSGFAHGFCATSEVVDVAYKVSTYYDPAAESGFRFDDPAVAIAWPLAVDQLQVSRRDRHAPTLAEISGQLPFRFSAAS